MYATIVHDLFFPSFFLSFRCHRPINDAFKVSEGTEEGRGGKVCLRNAIERETMSTSPSASSILAGSRYPPRHRRSRESQ